MRGRDIASAVAALLAVAVAIFVVGGAMRWTQALFTALVGVALVPVFTSRRSFARPAPLLVLLGACAVLCLLQLVPLPGGLVELLQPTGNALREDGAELVGNPASSALTLDPSGTIRALAVFVSLFGLAVVSLRTATSERGRYYMLVSLAACCGLCAVIVGIHKLFGLRVLYGLYTPDEVNSHLLGPLLNLNHLGCLMAVGTNVSLGLVAHRRQRAWVRLLWLVNAGACGIVVVATVSRGATLALVAGAIVTGATLVSQRLMSDQPRRHKRTQFLTSSLPIGVVAVCMVVIVVFSNAANVMSQLSHTSTDEVSDSKTKFAAWRSGIELVREAPVLGVGRGAFETSFTRVHPGSSYITFSHVENEYVQVVIDWGLVGGLVVFGLAGWLAFSSLRRWRDGALSAGALGAIAVVAIQSTVDFGVEMIGIAAPLTVLFATLSYVPLRDPASSNTKRWTRPLRAGLIAAVVGCALVLLTPRTMSVDDDHLQLRAHPTLELVRAALLRHPLDYYSFATASELHDHGRDPASIRLLNHAMRLHPTHPGLHHAAARMLLRVGHDAQAAIELGTALRLSSDQTTVLRDIVLLQPDIALSALPIDSYNAPRLIRQIQTTGHPALLHAYLRRLVADATSRPHACEVVFQLAIAGDAESADLAVSACLAPLPDYPTRLALAQARAGKSAYKDVVSLLSDADTWLGPSTDRHAAWMLLCRAYATLHNWDDAKRCFRMLDVAPDTIPDERLTIEGELSALEKARREEAALTAPKPSP